MLQRRPKKSPRRERHLFVDFQVGGRRLFLDAARVIGVAELEHFTNVPSDVPWNLGVVVFRGALYGLLDLDTVLRGRPRRPPTGLFFCVFARFPRGVAGFPVEATARLATTYGEAPPEGKVLDLDGLEAFR